LTTTTTVGAASIRNVVITRSKEGNEELAVRLKRAGFNPISVNTISLSPPKDWSGVDGLLRRLHSFDWLVFTSAVGVEYFDKRMKALSLQLPWHGKPLVAAVGERTADKVTGLGVKPSFIPSSYLTKKLAEELPAGDGNQVLLLRADIADPNLSERLKERGYTVEETAIYRTQIAAESRTTDKERLRDADVIVFASSSAVRGFCAMVSKDEMARLKRMRAICTGPVTEAAAKENGFTNTIMPKSHTLDAVVEELERLSQRDA
jgi:uroporphyrinogen-III synthase